jgi:hypothetical protein
VIIESRTGQSLPQFIHYPKEVIYTRGPKNNGKLNVARELEVVA